LLVVLGEGPLSDRPQNAADDASTATVGEAGHRTGLVQALFQKQGHKAFALLETAHEQCYECHQSRFGRTPWHTCRKFATGCLAAADTREPMTLTFRDERFDFRNFPDLMPQRGGIIPGQRLELIRVVKEPHDFFDLEHRTRPKDYFSCVKTQIKYAPIQFITRQIESKTPRQRRAW
jgi:hypothetical protein